MNAPLITLTTDWGTNTIASGMVKGKLLCALPEARIIDITHNVKSFDKLNAAFTVEHACLNFPPGTIHIIDVISEERAEEGFIVLEYNQQYYICTNNGIPTVAFKGREVKVVEITPTWPSESYNFAAYDIFCDIAVRLATGTPLSEIGPETELQPGMPVPYMHIGNTIKVHVMYIDNYGNAYLDIRYDELKGILQGRSFNINHRGYSINKIQHDYVGADRLVLTVSATGLMEIAIHEDSAAQLLGLRNYETLTISINGSLPSNPS